MIPSSSCQCPCFGSLDKDPATSTVPQDSWIIAPHGSKHGPLDGIGASCHAGFNSKLLAACFQYGEGWWYVFIEIGGCNFHFYLGMGYQDNQSYSVDFVAAIRESVPERFYSSLYL